MEYPKIHSLYMRDPITNKFTTEFSKPEFDSEDLWHVEEKIDGMNMRVYIDNGKITDIKGRTDAASIPPKLLKWLGRDELVLKIMEHYNTGPVILFGEGFGAGIQSGGIYRKDQAMILFDCYMGGRWSTRLEILEIAGQLGMEVPAFIGLMTKEEAIKYVKSKPKGFYGDQNYPMEGVMCRSEPLVRYNTRSANPVMFKLKVKDFK